MRLTINSRAARVGNVDIHELSRVVELDAGLATGPSISRTIENGKSSIACSYESLTSIEKRLAIIVPCMNEESPIFAGVLHGIPHYCLIIVVSNSSAANFAQERAVLTEFCDNTQRQGIAIHQQDAGIAQAFAKAGLPHVTTTVADGTSRIRSGKGEAMMIGTALAKIVGRDFVGFIDADNFVPGAVHEYCKVFAAGLYNLVSTSPGSVSSDTAQADNNILAMVRLKWKSKPKIVDGKLVPKESGRCSQVVNHWMNRLLTALTGDADQKDLIKTANAGEHAMSLGLALRLNFATGYAVEPFQLIDAWERSSSSTPQPAIKIMQIETLNPHIHDFGKGEEHVLKMQAQGLSTIYHSQLTPPHLKAELGAYMEKELASVLPDGKRPGQACVYPPMQTMDFQVFGKLTMQGADTLLLLNDR